MSWKEGKDLYLVILLLAGITVAEGVLSMGGEERREREAAQQSEGGPGGEGLSVASVMGASADDSLYARVMAPRPFVFPEDHGPHPDHRTEWWYVTGNVDGEDGTPLGFQFTLFRSAVAPSPPETSSAWGTNQVYLGHLGITDGGGGEHHHAERFARGAAGLAGAQAEPLRVWLEDWELAGEGSRGSPVGDPDDPDAAFPLRLRAADGELELDLVLTAGKGIVLQGDRGFSRKGSDPGNASYYYSYPRMPTTGTIRVGGRTHTVTGLSWMDREWSTSALESGQTGWDWFALQLDDGTDLMLYQLRGPGDVPDGLSRGTLMAPDGGSRSLTPDEWSLEVLERWRSPVDGTSYPARWRIGIPSEGLELEVTPLLADQEMNVTFRYWEGAVSVQGTATGGAVQGRGFVELTGYADQSDVSTEGVRTRGSRSSPGS